MHPQTKKLVQKLSGTFEVLDQDDGTVAIAYRGHTVATYDPEEELLCLHVALRVESGDGQSVVSINLTELAMCLQDLKDEGLLVSGHQVERHSADVATHFIMIEGRGLAPGRMSALITFVWGWSLGAILTSTKTNEKILG
jgi:hypothetical protein